MSTLPIEDVLPSVCRALGAAPNALLTAPPGAGKTTRVPLALLNAPWLSGKKLLLLEPRRLAARAAAHRMAEGLHEHVGETVGYRMRLETKIGPTTKIEVVTEGVLTRLLQQDPSLDAYGIVLFDEFHERSLQADVGLALCLETQRLFRPDLRLFVMSATLDCGPVAELLGRAPLITCEGRLFPVETRYLDRPLTGPLDVAVSQLIRQSLARDHGSLLVFLPGMAEIRRVERLLLDSNLDHSVQIAPLHGDLPQDMQDVAIRPTAPGRRKVVLATSIAETSLTIDGIRVVIDAGRVRIPRYDTRSGLTRLETMHVTRDSAEQRRGRAGRLEAGLCYRLWTEKEQALLAPRRPPEILDADLTPLMLDLAQWGAHDPSELSWLTSPPAGAVAQARDLLVQLGAFSADGRPTDHARRMAELPLHPRLAHMMLRAVPLGLADLACEVAALLSERDILHGPRERQNADVRVRLDVLRGQYDSIGLVVNRAAVDRVRRTARLSRRQLIREQSRETEGNGYDCSSSVGRLLALAYPDRIAWRQSDHEGRYRLVNGRGARFRTADPLAMEPFLVIADLDGGGQWSKINLAAPITPKDIESLYKDRLVEEEEVVWDEALGAVRAVRRQRLGALILFEEAASSPDAEKIKTRLLDGIHKVGLEVLPFGHLLQQWRARVMWLRRVDDPQSEWPDLSGQALLQTLDQWLGPYLTGMTTLDRVKRLDLTAPLHALLTHEQLRRLDRLAPTHIIVPSGSRLPIDYDSESPVLAVRLQEMFGCKDTPCIADGKIPLILHLLSPAKQPVQVTQDLGGFWKRAYPDVRKELRGRYPKHHWPENPLCAAPTAKAKQGNRS